MVDRYRSYGIDIIIVYAVFRKSMWDSPSVPLGLIRNHKCCFSEGIKEPDYRRIHQSHAVDYQRRV